MNEPYWAVCRAFSNRVHIVRRDIEKTEHGTFLPTFAKVWVSDGKLSCRTRALMPGYLFFVTEPDRWGEVANVDGVFGVLANNGRAGRVTDAEMHRLVMGHVLGDHADVNLDGLQVEAQPRRRHRRPRPSKRARTRA
jgi:transcription antitermination factor NusG